MEVECCLKHGERINLSLLLFFLKNVIQWGKVVTYIAGIKNMSALVNIHYYACNLT